MLQGASQGMMNYRYPTQQPYGSNPYGANGAYNAGGSGQWTQVGSEQTAMLNNQW
jgi:hypothetical protein